MRIDICIPVFNEEKIIEKNIQQLKSYLEDGGFDFQWRIVLANNGSTDGTGAICERLSGGRIHTTELARPGKGGAIKHCARSSDADIFVYMDVDLAVSIENLPDLISLVADGRHDIAIGSRLLPASRTERSWFRTLTSKGYNLTNRLMLGVPFSDLQCGFKAIKLEAFRLLEPFLENDEWFFDTELLAFAVKNGLKVAELPIDWKENRYQERKSRIRVIRDSIKFLHQVLLLSRRLKSH